MAMVVRFPRLPRVVPIGGLRCEGCGGVPFIFAPQVPVRAWCSPFCAAAAGLQPWAGCGEAERALWAPRPDSVGEGAV